MVNGDLGHYQELAGAAMSITSSGSISEILKGI